MTAVIIKTPRTPSALRMYHAFFKVVWTGAGPQRILVVRTTWYTVFERSNRWVIESQILTVHGLPRRFINFETESDALDWLADHAPDYEW